MTAKKRSDAELQAASNHLYYEIWMLISAAEAILPNMDDAILKNALLESFAIHVRALIDFFFPPSSAKPTDVLCTDFTATASYSSTLPPKLTEVRNRVHKEVAHLTYDRQLVSEEAKKWNLGIILSEMLPIAKAFVDNLPSYLLGDRWTKDEHLLRSRLTAYTSSQSIVGATTTDASTQGEATQYKSRS
jgi:hypothetical protein